MNDPDITELERAVVDAAIRTVQDRDSREAWKGLWESTHALMSARELAEQRENGK